MNTADNNSDKPETGQDVTVSRPLAFNRKAIQATGDVSAADVVEASKRIEAERLRKKAVAKNTEALLNAIEKNGTAREIEELITEQDIDLAVRDQHGNTLLHKAVENGNLSALAVMINHGFDLHARNSFGATPLMCAAVHYTTCAAGVMLADADPDLAAHSVEGIHVLHAAAAQYGMTRLVEKLLQRGVPADIADPDGYTPLVHALVGRHDSVEVICAAGGFRSGDMPMLQEAMKHQDSYGTKWDYEYLFDRVSKLDRDELIRSFPKQEATLPRTPDWITEDIFRTLRGGSDFRMERFDSLPVAFEAVNHDGQSPLMALVEHGASYPARSIVYRSDCKVRDNAGRTVLHYAVRSTGTGRIVEDAMCPENLEAEDIMGRTALMESVMHCSDYIETLIEEGADPRHQDRLGLTPMDIAKIRRDDYAMDRLQEGLDKYPEVNPRWGWNR